MWKRSSVSKLENVYFEGVYARGKHFTPDSLDQFIQRIDIENLGQIDLENDLILELIVKPYVKNNNKRY